ncbi:hypothetical protein KBX50_06275 [Micromonospora sp. C51]|uniref:hypothetical protein n=1 Tax=Micromonospora sp. C51 TaxID=2824879 RepID=UPI001B38F742|nr:hypothetical protein [Micromonospora sp. C51]MBQ1048067.1 hypothetical protein [Micromonospora sp. C51]
MGPVNAIGWGDPRGDRRAGNPSRPDVACVIRQHSGGLRKVPGRLTAVATSLNGSPALVVHLDGELDA